MSTTGIASHRPLPFGAIRQEWEAMLKRVASICPIHYSDIGLDTTGDAEVVIGIEHRKHVAAIEHVLFSNLRLDPLYRYSSAHLITFVARQRLGGQRERGPWRIRPAVNDVEVPGPTAEDRTVAYAYEGSGPQR